MRRWAIPACGAAILSAILILALPHLIARSSLQHYLLRTVEQALGVKAQVGAIGWRWLPLPALTITRLAADGDAFTLNAPEAHLVLHPRAILSALARATTQGPPPSRALFGARLIDPELTIKGRQKSGAIPAFGRLRIVNGHVSLPGQTRSDGLSPAAITLTAVNGTIAATTPLIKFDLRAGSSFAHSLAVKGTMDPRQGSYQLEVTAEGLDSSGLFGLATPSGGTWSPMVQGLDFTAHLVGEGPDRCQLQVTSKNGPFQLTLQGRTFTVARVDGLTLDRHGDAFTITAGELSLAEPLMRLSGHVSRGMQGTTPKPVPEGGWSIDINGADLDLGAIRTHILGLFGQHPVAQEVCAIVGGGGATTARFTFTGVTTDFQHLRSMGIWAEARDVPVTIPKLDLVLDRASGPIAIVNGQLTGHGLTATIAQSQGTNGVLLLDLEKDRHGFTLDLDLDADLKNLKDVLTQIIPSPRFQEELGHFNTIKGRAQGHLKLGDELHHLETRVEVAQVNATGRYDRLPWPFTIQAGQLRVGPQHVEWEGVTGTLDKQRVANTKGAVTWQDGLRVDLQALDADLDLQSLVTEGSLPTKRATLVLKDFIHGRFNDLAGQAHITSTTLSGPIARPEEWRYHAKAKASALRITTNLLPELHNGEVEAEISEQEARFAGVFDLVGQGLFLAGHYRHHLFTKWQGDLEVNGTIGEELGAWLKAKELIPAALFPRLPVRVEKLVLTNPDPGFNTIQAHGQIMALPQAADAVLTLAISRQPDQTMNTFTFTHGAEQGALSYQTWPGPGNRSLFSWQGELDFQTINALFTLPSVESGSIRGAGSRLIDHTNTVYSGELRLAGVRFTPQSLTPELTIDTLRLRGNAKQITVDQANFGVAGAQATLAGTVTEAEGRPTLDLHVTTPQLSWTSIHQAFDDFANRRTPAEQQSTVNSMRGTIALDIGSFVYRQPGSGHDGQNEGEAPHTFTATPFQGEVRLNEAGVELAIDKATVCGISGHGTWFFGGAKGEDTITFSSGQAPLSFAKALPCLGIKQSLIIGPFSVNGHLQGRPKAWRQGSMALTSSEGLIRRMNLLSKIFTTVNFTDYFTWQDLPDIEEEGLYYNELAINGHVAENHLVLDRTIVKGKGVNLSGRGTINLTDLDSDLTFFIAPFKIIDSLLTNIPLIGKALGGPKGSLLTFPVTVTGNIRTPEVTAMAPEAVGGAFLEMFKDTLTLPFRILQPDEEEGQGQARPATPLPEHEPQP
jgi:hypothetical protein